MRKSKYVFLKSAKPSRAVAQTYGHNIRYYIKAMVRYSGVLLGIYQYKRGQLTRDTDVHKLIILDTKTPVLGGFAYLGQINICQQS